MSTLDVIIVSYNTRDDLVSCLESLRRHRPSVDHTLTVVDNGSADESVDAVVTRWPDVRVIETGANLGYAAANNIGIRATTGEFLLLLNPDTVVPEGAIDGLVTRLAADAGVVAIGPRLVDATGRPELSFGRMIGPLNELRQKVLGIALARDLPWLGRRVARSLTIAAERDWVSGACLLVRRTACEAAGLLDDRFGLYGEDVDLCATLRRRGGRVLFWPAVEVIHHGGRSGRARPRETRRLYRTSQLAFYAKHHRHWVPALRLYLRLRGQLPTAPPSD